MKVISCFTFNGENAILRLHLGILNDYVDKFVILEANKTFTGQKKPLYFFRDERFFKPWLHKIEYYPLTDWDDTTIWEQAVNSPNTKGAEHWKREFYVKESLHKALKYAKAEDEDLILLGDVDEVVDPSVTFESEGMFKARLRVYSYHLNNRSDEPFWGTLVAKYGEIKDKCLNHLRSDKSLYSDGPYLGWHFTNMGGEDMIRRKLNDSYTLESYNTPEVQSSLKARIEENKDYLGRNFSFTLDESEWPKYLSDNRKKYELLCK